MRIATLLAALAVSAVGLAGCGGDDNGADAVTTTETTTTATTTQTGGETTPTTPAAQVKAITIRVVGGQPQGGIQRPTIHQGDKVVLVVRTDSGEAVHLHGYNIEKEIVPGKPLRLPFTASIAGRFELELHPTDTLLAVLEVKP
jgi:ABC-type glycerol-3-phosphate transport system substrate-binding protein